MSPLCDGCTDRGEWIRQLEDDAERVAGMAQIAELVKHHPYEIGGLISRLRDLARELGARAVLMKVRMA